VVISHVTYEDQPREVLEAQKLSARTATEIVLRSKAEILEQFSGLTLVEPGLVHLPLWRPDSPADVDEHPERFGAFGGVGRKE
jgi:S-adenosyl methyltransferase